MDPVTAFGLAVGILQVVDVSCKAFAKCQEIYKDGSLADNRSTAEITKSLSETTNRLDTSLRNAPFFDSRASKDILEISTRCSKTAAELLTELEKLRLESGEGRRQAIVKGIRALRRRNFLADIQDKLATYQRVLDTRILVGLNSHALQQVENFKSLDQSVKDLATALDKGHNTVTKLLADQSSEIRNHIDRRFDDQALLDQELKARVQFKDTLFFPELYSRQEDIQVAHEGTCRWIFTDAGREGKAERQPWPSLADWFEHGDEPYWLSGKPGSGKSTLMKYITEEFRSHIRYENALTSGIVVASFFFWNPGSALQKTLIGFLRSILYQIADQRPDLIPIMEDQQENPTRTPNKDFLPTPLYAWTEHRLSLVLRRLLAHIPPTVNLFFFIDGLDEFDGEEGDLMSLVRLLHQTPQAKVCVSSRPEQIFRQGFAQSPQIKLHDLNFSDLKKAAEDRLYPTLNSYFPEEKIEVKLLIKDTIEKAQGVFLWLELVAKSLQKGACNADTMEELYEKLEGTPDTIDGMYQHMLDGLDKSYLSEALKYFARVASDSSPTLLHFVFGDSDSLTSVARTNRGYFTSSEFTQHCRRVETRILTRCAGLVEIQERRSRFLDGVDGFVYDHESGTLHDPEYPPEISDAIDPEDFEAGYIIPTSNAILVSLDKQNPSRHLRDVRFIHKTVRDFLRDRFKKVFPDPDEHSAAYSGHLRAQLGVMNLLPIMVSRSELGKKVLTFFPFMEGIMDYLVRLEGSKTFQNSNHAFGEIIVATVNQTYRDIECIDAALNGLDVPWFERYERDSTRSTRYGILLTPGMNMFGSRFSNGVRRLPFHDSSGFAAFFGCQSHVLHSQSLHACSQEQIDYLLACTITGLRLLDEASQLYRIEASFTIIRELLHRGASWDSTSHMTPQSWAQNLIPLSAWVAFLRFVGPLMKIDCVRSAEKSPGFANRTPQHFARVNALLKDIVTLLLSSRADVNTGIFSTIWLSRTETTNYQDILVALEETPLSFMEKIQPSRGPDPLGILENMLQSHGGIKRRRCHFICLSGKFRASTANYHRPLPNRWYRLSPLQSDCLCDMLHSYPHCLDNLSTVDHGDPEMQRDLENVLLGLTENDLVPSRNGEAQSFKETASSSSDKESSADKVAVSFVGS